MWRRKSERKRGVQLRMKERKCSQVQMMGKRSEHGQIQTRRKREEGAAWEEVRGSLVSNPDVREMEGIWIQMQKRVLGSRSRKDMEGA